MDNKTNTVGYLLGFEVWRKICGNSWWESGGVIKEQWYE
jgi:hypothetical protein